MSGRPGWKFWKTSKSKKTGRTQKLEAFPEPENPKHVTSYSLPHPSSPKKTHQKSCIEQDILERKPIVHNQTEGDFTIRDKSIQSSFTTFMPQSQHRFTQGNTNTSKYTYVNPPRKPGYACETEFSAHSAANLQEKFDRRWTSHTQPRRVPPIKQTPYQSINNPNQSEITNLSRYQNKHQHSAPQTQQTYGSGERTSTIESRTSKRRESYMTAVRSDHDKTHFPPSSAYKSSPIRLPRETGTSRQQTQTWEKFQRGTAAVLSSSSLNQQQNTHTNGYHARQYSYSSSSTSGSSRQIPLTNPHYRRPISAPSTPERTLTSPPFPISPTSTASPTVMDRTQPHTTTPVQPKTLHSSTPVSRHTPIHNNSFFSQSSQMLSSSGTPVIRKEAMMRALSASSLGKSPYKTVNGKSCWLFMGFKEVK